MFCSRFCAVTMTGSKIVVSWATAVPAAARLPSDAAMAIARFFLCTAKLPMYGSRWRDHKPVGSKSGQDRAWRPRPTTISRVASSEAGDHRGAHRQRRSRRDVVVVMRIRVVALVEQVLDIELQAQPLARRVVNAGVDAREPRQFHEIVGRCVHVRLVDHAETDAEGRAEIVTIPERGDVLWQLRETGPIDILRQLPVLVRIAALDAPGFVDAPADAELDALRT